MIRFLSSLSHTAGMDLKEVVCHLTRFAPTNLAAKWDNVGLLVEPTPPHTVNKLCLTNDLTEAVMEEALQHKCDMILSYHPPIFVPLKRLTQAAWKERIIVKCIENRVAVYSPHTSHDAVQGGVNDWLVKPFEGSIEAIETADQTTRPGYHVMLYVSQEAKDQVIKDLTKRSATNIKSVASTQINRPAVNKSEVQITFQSNENGLQKLMRYIDEQEEKDIISQQEIVALSKGPLPGQGPGRLVKLSSPTKLSDVVERVKQHLNLNHVRLAAAGPTDGVVKKIAVCAGSGGSVLGAVSADVYITGEMSHHEVLDAVHKGRSVILADHSNTERGYLAEVLKPKLSELLDNKVEVLVSSTDKDPLDIV